MVAGTRVPGATLQMRCQWRLDAGKESLITSVVFAGTMLGAYSWGWLSDAKGRRIGFFGTAMFSFMFGILSALAPNFQVPVAISELCRVSPPQTCLGGLADLCCTSIDETVHAHQ